MTIDVKKIGREIVEDLLKEAASEVGPCFFPGAFKPPHRGDFEAAKYLATKNYINRVYVVISRVEKLGVTAEDSLYIWNEYLKSDPDPKIKVMISEHESPVEDVYFFIKNHFQVDPVYVAAEATEVEGEGGYGNLKKNFPDRVIIETIPAGYTNISREEMLAAAKSKNYKKFIKYVPEISYNKGAAENIFSRLSEK